MSISSKNGGRSLATRSRRTVLSFSTQRRFKAVRYGCSVICVFFGVGCADGLESSLRRINSAESAVDCDDPLSHYDPGLLYALALSSVVDADKHQHLYRSNTISAKEMDARALQQGLHWVDLEGSAVHATFDEGQVEGTLQEASSFQVFQDGGIHAYDAEYFGKVFPGLCFRPRFLVDADITLNESLDVGVIETIQEANTQKFITEYLPGFSVEQRAAQIKAWALEMAMDKRSFNSAAMDAALLRLRYSEDITQRRFANTYLVKINDKVGAGLFAAEVVKSGDLIGMYDGVEFQLHWDAKKRQYDSVRLAKSEEITQYGAGVKYPYYRLIIPRPIGGYASFINHSKYPNASLVPIYWGARWRTAVVAIRDIAMHEQFSLDYAPILRALGQYACPLDPVNPYLLHNS